MAKKVFWVLCLYVVGIGTMLAGPRFAANAAPATCNAGWAFDHVALLGLPFVPFGPAYQNYNGTDRDETAIVTASTEGYVRVTTTFGWFIDTTILVSTIRHSLDKEVQSRIKVEVGNQIQMIIPPHKIGYARYGVYEVQAKGNYFYKDAFCNTLFPQDNITVWCPWYTGWDTKILGRDQAQKQSDTKRHKKN